MTDKKTDAALAAWARSDAADPDAVARLLAHADALASPAAAPAAAPARPPRRWMPWAAGGSALAATLALAMLVSGTTQSPAPPSAQVASVASVTGAAPTAEISEADSFSLLYTPTVDEEQYL